MSKYNILIVEDDLLIAEMLKEMLLEQNHSISGIAKNYNEAIKILSSNNTIDVVFLDINLSSVKSGIDVAKYIKNNIGVPYIFLTSYSDQKTISEATSTAPESYLIKPFTEADLFSTLEVLKAKQAYAEKSIMVKSGTSKIKLNCKEILFIKSEKNYLEIVSKMKRIITRMPLDGFIEELNSSNIIRVHRSYAVNTSKISEIKAQYVIIQDNEIPISRGYKKKVEIIFNSQ